MEARSLRSEHKRDEGIDKSPGVVARMFDLITPTYDQLNHLMSFSADRGWRKDALEELDATSSDAVLDVATGTGDMAIAAVQRFGCTVVGIDISRNMMMAAARNWEEWSDRYFLVQGDAMAMPFRDGTFDRATVAFGVRNMASLGSFLDEVRRCLKDGGRLVVLELSLPTSPVVRSFLLFYLTRVLPVMAKLQGGDPAAYRYLAESIITFPPPGDVEGLMGSHGLRVLSSRSLTMGACHLYVLEKEG